MELSKTKIEETIARAIKYSPIKNKINLGLQEMKTLAYIQDNWNIEKNGKQYGLDQIKPELLLPYIFQGVLNNFIIGEDYWVVNYKGKPTFSKTQSGNKKWLEEHFNVIDFTTGVVFNEDEFDYILGETKYKHKPAHRTTAPTLKDIKSGYVHIKFERYGHIVEKLIVVDKYEISQLKESSPSSSSSFSPWTKWPAEMVKAKASNKLIKMLDGLVKTSEEQLSVYKMEDSIGITNTGKIEYDTEPKETKELVDIISLSQQVADAGGNIKEITDKLGIKVIGKEQEELILKEAGVK